MFGSRTHLEQKLRDHGVKGRAEVLERKLAGSASSATLPVNMDDPLEVWNSGRYIWRLKLRVQGDGTPDWEGRVTCQLGVPVRTGTELPVLYDPDDHGKLMVDTEAVFAAFAASFSA